MFTQFDDDDDDDGRELWWHMQVGPTTKQGPSITHMRGNGL